ncbi:MAG: glycosyl hydrolase 115 family protein, partial [Verrucomicrobia bacterium]|nr:glycosyl hydrolase 115 family protein [Verrucomicrobiota bacterium]
FGGAPGYTNAANYGPGLYTNLFEVILRCRGNYLWPAMWNNAFNEDDTNNPALADMYGIVMGTSHQEPMLRAQKEWDRSLQHKYGNWNYNNTNQQPVLQQFWREGVRRNKNFESIITLGLRTENDSGTPIGKEMTEQIVGVQRNILAEEINPDLTKVPQMWCLYKEVQDFYNDGLRVPDDVTLLWAEDNWGDVRRLPTAAERKRSGGAGVYYHFDYHGGPRSYQWLNTSPLPKIWDQMSLAKQYGADRIWIVNMGHFKGYELPMEFFLSLGWNTERWTADNLADFTKLWATREFGSEYATEIADVLSQYAKYNGRRKPELVDANTYSLVNYQEFETVVADYDALVAKAQAISDKLPEAKRAAFYELVLFPTKASAQLNALYLAAAKNALYAAQGRASANDHATRTRELFAAETNLMEHFNRVFLDGKWDHFMDQSVIGYDSWRDPAQNNMGAIDLTEVAVPDAATLGVAVEGNANAFTNGGMVVEGSAETFKDGNAMLPSFDVFNQQRHWIDIFNKGRAPFDFAVVTSDPWIVLSETNGTVEKDKRLWISIDWTKVPQGVGCGVVKISGAGNAVVVTVTAFNPAEPARDSVKGFVEGEGYVSIEPEHFSANHDAGANRWVKLPDYGRTLSGMRATAPVDAPAATPGKDSPCLEYRMYLFSTNTMEVRTVTSPVLNFMPDRGIRFAVSFDDESPQTFMLVPQKYSAGNGNQDWERSVMNNARVAKSNHAIHAPG